MDSLLKLNNATEPRWGSLTQSIANKFNKYYADRTNTDAKRRWYATKEDMKKYTHYIVEYINKFRSSMR